MIKKKIMQIGNKRSSVKYILRGAQRRREKAVEAVQAVTCESGVQFKLYAVS